VGGVGGFTRVEHGQGELAFPEIVADGFADDGGEAAVVEQVVDDLEGAAEAAAVFAHRVGDGLVIRRGAGAGAGGGLEQGGGLGLDDGHVFRDGEIDAA